MNHTLSNISSPFAPHEALDQSDVEGHVPGYPNISLSKTVVAAFLDAELSTPVLDKLADRLWLFTTPSSSHIDPLHRSAVKSRSIVVSEDPALHLVWYRNKVFVKPIPRALLNYYFWRDYIFSFGSVPAPDLFKTHPKADYEARREPLQFARVALGFLRSYGHLIRHESDLKLAIEKGLVPTDTTWANWCKFISNFRNLDDEQVSPRYHYGQLRLTRLNYAVRIFRPPGLRNYRHYYEAHWDTLSFLERFLPPLLFIFACGSVMLSAMQVILSLPLDSSFQEHYSINVWTVKRAFWGFCIFALLCVLFWITVLLAGPLVYLIAQLAYGWKVQRARTRRSDMARRRSVDLEKSL